MDLASILLVVLPLVLLPAILMRGRKSAPLWTVLSAIGGISLLAAAGIGSQASGIVLDSFALAAGMLLFFVAIPIGVVGLALLVDRMVVRGLQWLRRSRRAVGVEDGGMDAAGDGESAPDPLETRRGGRRDLAIRITVGVVVAGLILAPLYGDMIELEARQASRGFIHGNIAQRVDSVMAPGVPMAVLESELTSSVKNEHSEGRPFPDVASRRWHPAVALMHLQHETLYDGPWVSLLRRSDAEVLSTARKTVKRTLVENADLFGQFRATRVSGPTVESRVAAESDANTFLRDLRGKGFRLNAPPVRLGAEPRVIPLLDGYQFQRIEYELTSDKDPSAKFVWLVHLGSPDGKQWYVVEVERKW